MNARASQRVQCGTNRPPGKSKKKSTTQTSPTICTPWTGNHQSGWEEAKASAFVVSTVTVPKLTRNIEVKSAIRSSERHQKMSTPTANHTSWKALSMMTFKNAYEPTDRPTSCKACTPWGVGCHTAHSLQTSGAAVHTLR